MRNNPEYLELNRRLGSALRESEAVAKELFDFRCKLNIEKGEVTDDPLVLRMDRDLSAVLEGLQSHDPRIRTKSLEKTGEPWKYPASAAPFIREVALHDPDLEVQLFAIAILLHYKVHFTFDSDLVRQLALLAQSSDDAALRHTIYLMLCQIHDLYDIWVFGLKYTLNPIIYDESVIEHYANASDWSDTSRAVVKPKAFDFWGWFRKKRPVGDDQSVPNLEAN